MSEEKTRAEQLKEARDAFAKRVKTEQEKQKPIRPLSRGSIQTGWNKGGEMKKTRAWLKTLQKSYEWAGTAYFPGEGATREKNVKHAAKTIADAIDALEKKVLDLVTINQLPWAFNWEGPLYARLERLLGNMGDALEAVVYMDYETAGYSRGGSSTSEWTDMLQKIKRTIQEYQREIESVYNEPGYYDIEQTKTRKREQNRRAAARRKAKRTAGG